MQIQKTMTENHNQNWWLEAFPRTPYGKAPPGEREMLTLVAYDISNPKRLAKVARICETFGVRVQYSFFECRLDEAEFAMLWQRLLSKIDAEEDRIVAYRLDARCAKETRSAGRMVCSERALCYLV
ncbi:MAG: CRISPR-associated endonuclease Cas2 [Verrucomicrobiota bacterium]|jgi:CRISPR-associated protein Cas2